MQTVSTDKRSTTGQVGEIPVALVKFDQLPDSSHVDIDVVRGLFQCGRSTVWSWVRNQQLPSPRKFGRAARWNVGELRKILAVPEEQ